MKNLRKIYQKRKKKEKLKKKRGWLTKKTASK